MEEEGWGNYAFLGIAFAGFMVLANMAEKNEKNRWPTKAEICYINTNNYKDVVVKDCEGRVKYILYGQPDGNFYTKENIFKVESEKKMNELENHYPDEKQNNLEGKSQEGMK